MIRYSGGPIVDTTYVSDGTKGQMITQITTALVQAGWSAQGSNIYQSVTTPEGFKIQVDVINGAGLCVHLRLRSPTLINTGFSDGGFLFPVNGREYRIMANKYQLFHWKTGATGTTDPSDICFGVLWTPPFMSIPAPPIGEQVLTAFTSSATEDCNHHVYQTWNYGPFSVDVSVRIHGHVDDDIRVNGVIWDDGLHAFNSGRGLSCDGVANGEHDFDKTITLTAGTPLVVELISNFQYTASINANLSISGGTVSSIDPWFGYLCSNGIADPPSGSNTNTINCFHGTFNLCVEGRSLWIWDGVAYWDTNVGEDTYLIAQMGNRTTFGIDDPCGMWEGGAISVYEPYVAWASGHATSGNWSPAVRKGQLWDALVYAGVGGLDGDVLVPFDDHNWRNVTQKRLTGGNRFNHSLLLLTA